jgi:hypothetical protein
MKLGDVLSNPFPNTNHNVSRMFFQRSYTDSMFGLDVFAFRSFSYAPAKP